MSVSIYTSFIHHRTGSKVKKEEHKQQTQMNLTNMQLYPNFTVQPGLNVIKKFNICDVFVFSANK